MHTLSPTGATFTPDNSMEAGSPRPATAGVQAPPAELTPFAGIRPPPLRVPGAEGTRSLRAEVKGEHSDDPSWIDPRCFVPLLVLIGGTPAGAVPPNPLDDGGGKQWRMTVR